MLLASGCSVQEALSFNAPDGATEQSALIESAEGDPQALARYRQLQERRRLLETTPRPAA